MIDTVRIAGGRTVMLEQGQAYRVGYGLSRIKRRYIYEGQGENGTLLFRADGNGYGGTRRVYPFHTHSIWSVRLA